MLYQQQETLVWTLTAQCQLNQPERGACCYYGMPSQAPFVCLNAERLQAPRQPSELDNSSFHTALAPSPWPPSASVFPIDECDVSISTTRLCVGVKHASLQFSRALNALSCQSSSLLTIKADDSKAH